MILKIKGVMQMYISNMPVFIILVLIIIVFLVPLCIKTGESFCL